MVSSLFLFSVVAGVVAEDESTLLQSARLVGKKACDCGEICHNAAGKPGKCLKNGRCDLRPQVDLQCGADCGNSSWQAQDLACQVGLLRLQDYCGSGHEASDVKKNLTAVELGKCDPVGDEECRVWGCDGINGPPHLSTPEQNLLQSGSNATAERGAQQHGAKDYLFKAEGYGYGTVNYMIDTASGLASTDSRLSEAISHWKTKTCITFRQCPNNKCVLKHKPYMRFHQPLRDTQCNSPMGVYHDWNEEPEYHKINVINLGAQCPTGTIIHEIGHSLGLAHEQVRSDRDEFVKILWDNVVPKAHGNFAETNSVRGRDVYKYDYASIMHYKHDAFGVRETFGARWKKTTIETDKEIGQRKALSNTDIASVNFMYNKCDFEKWTGNVPTCVNSRQLPTQQSSVEVQAVATVGQEFVVDFSANFKQDLTSTVQISPQRTVAKTSTNNEHDRKVAVSTVSFTPSCVGKSHLITATFTGKQGQQCRSKVKVTTHHPCTGDHPDHRNQCGGWAEYGDCKSGGYVKWMWDNCCRSCIDAPQSC